MAAVFAAVAAAVVAAAFAFYALLEPALGRPGAAALVALICALIAAVAALLMTRGLGGRRRAGEAAEADQDIFERVISLARAKPALAVGAALAAGLIAFRNPAIISLIATALSRKTGGPRR